jgi:hypothetical protein
MGVWVRAVEEILLLLLQLLHDTFSSVLAPCLCHCKLVIGTGLQMFMISWHPDLCRSGCLVAVGFGKLLAEDICSSCQLLFYYFDLQQVFEQSCGSIWERSTAAAGCQGVFLCTAIINPKP